MADRKLIVEIVGDDSQFQAKLNSTSRSLQQFGRDTQRTTGTRTGGVSTVNSPETQQFLGKIKENQREAEVLRQRIQAIGDEGITTGQKLANAAKIGAGFFVLGRGLQGAGEGLKTIQGEATPASEALKDAGQAIESLITLDPAGFFQAVGASAQRNREHLTKYAEGLTDINREGEALKSAEAVRALGFGKEADAILAKVDALKAASATLSALEFSIRKENVTTLPDGRTAIVTFRGAGVSEDVGGGLRGPGGVAVQQASQQRPITVNTEVKVDGATIARVTKKYNERDSISNPAQKRGGNWRR